jgi:hypothetical protein
MPEPYTFILMFMKIKSRVNTAFIILAMLAGISRAGAQGTLFTYQGSLNTDAAPANGFYDFKFSLYTNSTGSGTQVGSTLTQTAIGVTNGMFTTRLDFGAAFTGNATWMAISVRSNGVGSYTAMTPLQELTPAPYAITAENLDGTLPASQLSGTLPSGLLSGAYGGPLTISNAGDSFSGNGAGLNSLNASALTLGTVPDFVLNPDVALLDRPLQTFTGSNTFSGNAGSFVINNGSSAINTNFFTGLGLQYYIPTGEGAIMSSYNDGYGFLSFYTKQAAGFPLAKQMMIDKYGGVAIDQQGFNNGIIDHATSNGVGLTFGIASGEGIASKRTAGGNQFGLDFYTGFADRMSIANSGTVQFNNDLYLLGNTSGLGHRTNVAGISLGPGGDGAFLWGFDGGALGTVVPDEVSLSWDYYGNVWISNNCSADSLTVRGNYAEVIGANAYNGNGSIDAYIGGNGSGSDVQIGSENPNILNIGFWNTGASAYMHIYCSSITINGGADLAEPFAVSSPSGEIPQGSVVVIDDQNPGHLKVSSQAYDTRVAGVLSGANGINPGIQMQQQALVEGGKNVALTGRVYALADAANGAISPGDLLTTSATPGHAMKVSDHARASGAILGKAMSGLKEGRGMVLVLVTLQ